MIIKKGVSLLGVQPRIMFGMAVVETVWKKRFPGLDFVITCGTEEAMNPDVHGPKSKHRSGDALDNRTKTVRTLYLTDIDEAEGLARHALQQFRLDVIEALGGDESEFDYVLGWNPWRGHLEWDPERRRQ